MKTALRLMLILLLWFAVMPAFAASCSNASLKGVYGYFHGRPGGLGAQPVDVVLGQFDADGNGNVASGSFTLDEGGGFITGTLTGTYFISKNCTGT
jgi:hypothetical protein